MIFFIRRSNDIDHLAPVIWATARRGNTTRVLSLNPYLDLDADYRIRFLRSQSGVTIGHIYDLVPTSWLQGLIGRSMVAAGPLGHATRAAVVERRWTSTRARWFAEEWAARVIEALDAELLVFDWVKPEQHVVGELLAAAKRLNVPTIALPHGVSITTGQLRTRAAARAGALPDYGRVFPFDRFVAPHHNHADYFVLGGMPRARVDILGSARFCEEWVRKQRQFTPDAYQALGRDSRLNVVFFEKDSFSLNQGREEASVRLMSSLDFVHLVVKPQTRNNSSRLRTLGRIEIVPDIPSPSLTAWADVVVGTVSSILVEPLCVGKPLIYPAHHCTISTVIQERHACWEVHDDAQLTAALRLLADGGRAPVRQADVEACLDEIVYAGFSDRDVLGRYAMHLEALRSRTAGADEQCPMGVAAQ